MIDSSIKDKSAWQKEANMCQRFFDGPYKFMYGSGPDETSGQYLYVGKSRIQQPSMSVTVNKAFELVTLFGPSMYSRNPHCKTNPRKTPEIPPQFFGDPNDQAIQQAIAPMMQQMDQQRVIDTMRSVLLGGYLNYLPEAISMKDNNQQAIDEAIIKGAGVVWCVMKKLSGGMKIPTLEYDTVDHLLFDPDVESPKDATWIARRFCKPVWEVEVEHGLPHGTLQGNNQSNMMASAEESISANHKRKVGKTNDLLVYWGIWSKMGLGGLLRGIDEGSAEADRYGQYVYVEVCDDYPYFLNVPEAIWDNDEEVRRRVQWESPFWCDEPSSNGWPFEMFFYHRSPRKAWPVSHLKPALGELMFINWAYSFLISKVQKTSRDFIAIAKAASEELKAAILGGTDLTVLELEGNLGQSIDQVVKFLQHPEMNSDLLKVIQAVETNFDKRTGLNELMYGLQDTQDRSAAESNNKAQFVNIRPDDMKQKTEETLTGCFRKLALMARWHMSGSDIARVFGPTIGQLWDVHVATADVDELLHCIEYRIEAGSAVKPNKQKDQNDATQIMQTLMPIFSQLAMAGHVEQANALITFWCKAFDIDPSPMLFPPPPPPQPPVPDPPKISVSLKGEDIAALGLDQQIREDFGAQGPAPNDRMNPQVQQSQIDAQKHGQDLLRGEQLHQQHLKHATEKQKLDMEILKKKKAMMSNGSQKKE